MTYQEMLDYFNKLFLDHPDGEDAKTFLHHYMECCHKIDDIIDEKIIEPEKILEPFHNCLTLYSSNFYRKYTDILFPVINHIHHTWLDSVSMERSPLMWQKEQADVLRLCSVEMSLIIIQILGGYAARRKYSIAIREHGYKRQHEIIEST